MHVCPDIGHHDVARASDTQVVLGDDTWAQLAPPSSYHGCHTFPSFDVHDLHTVDDGVWRVRLCAGRGGQRSGSCVVVLLVGGTAHE